MRLLAPLHQLAHDRHPRGAQQLAQLLQVVAVGQGGDAEGSLACALGLFHLRVSVGRTSRILNASVYADQLSISGLDRNRCNDRLWLTHHPYPPSAPSRLTASSRLSSGVVSEIRNQPSPAGPYIAPGESTTAACSSTCSQYASELA